MSLFKKEKGNFDTHQSTNNSTLQNNKNNVAINPTRFSFSDLFHIVEFKNRINLLINENQQLKEENIRLEEQANTRLTLQQMKPKELDELIDDKNSQIRNLDYTIHEKDLDIKNQTTKLTNLSEQLNNLKSQIIDVSDELMYESYGLYKPKYNFTNSSTYKGKLTEIRSDQKAMIKDSIAAKIFQPMTLNDSKAQGKSMQKKNIKQLLRSFNGECEAAINKVTKSNFNTIEKRINRSFEQLNKLNEPNGVRLTVEYLDSKINEARLALEYALKKEEEKDILREQKQREREERQLQRELANERKKYEKDETHFQQAQKLVEEKIKTTSSEVELVSLRSELNHLKEKLAAIQEKKVKLEDRAANPTAGYVYIISNIGSFGENVYKIGVTRRLDPMERINELGSASVPFKFDVHALIFSDQAYQLEKELHDYFDKQRVNKINKRKEYFNITIDEIKKVLAQHKELTFDFHELPDAPEYRDSQIIEQQVSIKE